MEQREETSENDDPGALLAPQGAAAAATGRPAGTRPPGRRARGTRRGGAQGEAARPAGAATAAKDPPVAPARSGAKAMLLLGACTKGPSRDRLGSQTERGNDSTGPRPRVDVGSGWVGGASGGGARASRWAGGSGGRRRRRTAGAGRGPQRRGGRRDGSSGPRRAARGAPSALRRGIDDGSETLPDGVAPAPISARDATSGVDPGIARRWTKQRVPASRNAARRGEGGRGEGGEGVGVAR